MRDFFKQCLEDLEALTGNRQMYYFATDADGQRKLKVCLDGMVLAANDYPFIPEEAKRKIIRDQMVKDQNYEALNSRTVHKWLTAAANAYRTHSQFTEDDLTPRDQLGNPAEPAPPEVADKYYQQWLASLVKIGNVLPTIEQIKADLKEVKRVETGRQKFVIEGIEVWAMNQEEAQKAFDYALQGKTN